VSFLRSKTGREPYSSDSGQFIERILDAEAAAIEALQGAADAEQYSLKTGELIGTTFNRVELVELIKERLSCIADLVKSVLESSQTSLDSIDFVLVNGRPAANKLIRSTIASHFRGKRIVILNANLSSCFGAALHAGVLNGLLELPKLHDILTQTVHLACEDSLESLIPQGTVLPTASKASISAGTVQGLKQSRVPASSNDSNFIDLPLKVPSKLPDTDEYRIAVSIDHQGIVTKCEIQDPVQG
jgi:molecular chaperone DnaK (HSP70)